MTPYLSVIIPAHNEANRLPKTLQAVSDFLASQTYLSEIIVINDGSTDETAHVVSDAISKTHNVSLTSLTKNEGKGSAVKAGMLQAQGQVRLFMDADNSTRIEEIEKMLPYLSNGNDIVIGSRRARGAKIEITQTVLREILGAIFRNIAHLLVPLDIQDTQNGFKLFSAKASKMIFPEIQTKGLSFDIEVLLRARKLGFKVKEVPITWRNDGESKVTFFKMTKMLVELYMIRSNSYPHLYQNFELKKHHPMD